jgi:hypothetical protein
MNELFDTGSTIDFRPSESGNKEDARGFPGEVAQRIRVTELSIQVLIEQSRLRKFCRPGYDETARLIEALPLATSAFAFANRHLQNAVEYSLCAEFGAAAFELRLVRGCIQRL